MAEMVTIEAEGRVVTGKITRRTKRFIEVELISPLWGLTTSSTVPIIVSGLHNLLGEEGDSTARALLAQLHRQAVEMTDRREELIERWRRAERELQFIDDTDPGVESRLRPLRLELRRQFKGGTLDQKQYQRELKKLKHLREAYEERRWAILDGFRKEESWGIGLDLEVILGFLKQE